MQIKYLGPSGEVNVAPYGPHRKGDIKEYPDDFAEELLATSIKQHFEAAGEWPAPKPEPEIEPVAEPEPEPVPEPEIIQIKSGKKKAKPKGKK